MSTVRKCYRAALLGIAGLLVGFGIVGAQPFEPPWIPRRPARTPSC
jgi:hypothetical protein